MFSQASHTKYQEHQPAWIWDVHADGVIFSYQEIRPILSPSPSIQTSQAILSNQINQENRPSLLDYFHLSSPIQIPGDP